MGSAVGPRLSEQLLGSRRQLLPGRCWEKWRMASEGAAGLRGGRGAQNGPAGPTGWSDSGVTGQEGSCPDQRGPSLRPFLNSGRRPTAGPLPILTWKVSSPGHPKMVGHPERVHGSLPIPIPQTLGDEGTGRRPSHDHHGARLAPPLPGPFDGSSRGRPAHIRLPGPPCLSKEPPRLEGHS